MSAFAELFTFARARPAPYTDMTGAAQVAAVNTPRFDFAAGAPLGLLVEGFPDTAQPDLVALTGASGLAEVTEVGTVLHSFQAPDGSIVRNAVFTAEPLSVINSLLKTAGWHRRVTWFATQLPSANNQVGWNGQAYTLTGGLIASYGAKLTAQEAGGQISTGAAS